MMIEALVILFKILLISAAILGFTVVIVRFATKIRLSQLRKKLTVNG